MSAALEMSGQIGTMAHRFRRRPSKVHHLAAGLSVIAALSLVVPAAAQTVKIQTIKVTAPGTTTAPGKPAALGNAASRPHVYLMRGLMNIFSLGMDQLAGQIAGSGIDASVYNHSVAESVVGSIVQRYRGGDHGPYILVGHSLGADAVMTMTQQLNLQGVPVALVVPFDGTGSYTTPSNVACVLNFTQRAYAYMQAGAGFHGKLSNVDVSSDTSIDHVTIDKSPRLQAMALKEIMQAARGKSCRPAGTNVPAVARAKQTAPKEIAPQDSGSKENAIKDNTPNDSASKSTEPKTTAPKQPISPKDATPPKSAKSAAPGKTASPAKGAAKNGPAPAAPGKSAATPG